MRSQGHMRALSVGHDQSISTNLPTRIRIMVVTATAPSVSLSEFITSAADDPRNHDDFLSLGVKSVNSLGWLAWRHLDGRGSFFALLSEDALGLPDSRDSLGVSDLYRVSLPRVPIISTV
jgi:hypothetical protein